MSQSPATQALQMLISEPLGHRRRRIPVIRQTSGCSHSLQRALRDSGCEQHGMLAPDRWDPYERNEPRLLHPPIHRKALNSFTWGIWFFNSQEIILMFRIPGLGCKYRCNLTPPLPPQSSSLRVTWAAISWTWSPKNSHQIKHNSQLLGCEWF